KIRAYHVDFTNPANSTFTLEASVGAASFTSLCSTTRNCVPQAGTTSKLDAIGDRLMFRNAYRRFADGHESLLNNYTVSANAVAGIRWFELQRTQPGNWGIFQQSTYQPDTTWRWMGSIASDNQGNIALGFSASSSSINPQIRYAGRLATDSLNTLSGEQHLFDGTGSQTGTSNRWGDYSDMTVDPVDDCTFWYTTEYYTVTTSFSWHTRIGSFALPGCGGPPTTGSISGLVTDASTSAPISGATVSISGGTPTTTDGTGAYSFSGLAPATYSLTASKAGYVTSNPALVPVTAGNTSPQDFALTPTATQSSPFAFASATAHGTGGDGNGYETNELALLGVSNG